MGPENSKFPLYLKQAFQPLSILSTNLHGEKGGGEKYGSCRIYETIWRNDKVPLIRFFAGAQYASFLYHKDNFLNINSDATESRLKRRRYYRTSLRREKFSVA